MGTRPSKTPLLAILPLLLGACAEPVAGPGLELIAGTWKTSETRYRTTGMEIDAAGQLTLTNGAERVGGGPILGVTSETLDGALVHYEIEYEDEVEGERMDAVLRLAFDPRRECVRLAYPPDVEWEREVRE